MKDEAAILFVRFLIYVVNAIGIQERCTALDPTDFIPFFENELSEIRAVLTGDTSG